MADDVAVVHDAALGEPSRNTYMRGCRCVACKDAQKQYRAERRKSKNTEVGRAVLAAVPDVPVQPVQPPPVQPEAAATPPVPDEDPQVPLSVVEETRREIATLAGAELRPGLVAAALRMAQVLDNPEALTQWPQATSRLADVLEQLGKGGRKKRGNLATVRGMTGTG